MVIFLFLGLISAVFQLTLFREFSFSIAKNELSFIVAVGIWLAACSLGSLAGLKKKKAASNHIGFVFSLVFCLAVAFIHLAKSFFGSSYYEASALGFVLTAAFVFIGSTAFLIGYSFCIFSRVYLEKHPRSPETFSYFFVFEAIGLFIGGLVFTFFLSSYSNPFVFSFFPLLFLLFFPSSLIKKVFSGLGIALVGLFFILSFGEVLEKEFKGAEILMNKGTRYGPAVLARSHGVKSLYVNGFLSQTSEDKAWDEEFIHTCLSANKSAGSLLFIGPYFSGQVDEILKYKINDIDCVDVNPFLSGLSSEQALRIRKQRVNLIVDDPRLYVKNTAKKYDYIVMNMPAPASLGFNRYFSYEFFQLIRRHLTEKGAFCFSIPSKRDILSSRILKFNSCILNSLDKVFKQRLSLPGDSMIIIAALEAVNTDKLAENFSQFSIKTEYFTAYHLKDVLDSERRFYLESMIDKTAGINRDLIPRGFLYYLLLEQAKFYPGLSLDVKTAGNSLIIVFGLAVVLAGLFSLSKVRAAVLLNAAVTGFLSIGMTAIVFLLFQIYSGALFWKMGVLTAMFMLGLASGAFFTGKALKKVKIALKYFYAGWILFILSLFAGLIFLTDIFYADFIFYIYSFLTGCFTGAVYPLIVDILLGNKADYQKITPSIYAADLAGAFLGTFAFSILFIPFLGIILSLAMLMGLAFIFWLFRCIRPGIIR